MSWDTLGIRKLNKLQDQPLQLANWSSAQAGVQMRALQTAGYLKALELEVPQMTIAGTIGTGTIAKQATAQLGELRSIAQLSLSTQAIANLLNLTGPDLYFLRYVYQGRNRRPDFTTQYAFDAPPSAPNGGVSLAGIATSESLATNNVTLGLNIYIPMTMDILLRGVATGLSDSSGKPVVGPDGKPLSAVLDRELEISLISLQSSELAIQPSLLLNPAYSPGVNSPMLVTGNSTGTGTFAGRLNSYIYDVPTNAADRPNGYQTSLILARQFVETPVAGGSVEVPFRKAGSLLRAMYVAQDTNGLFVDWATAPGATLQFGWGSRVTKINETVESNINSCLRRYSEIPPQGLLVHDFITDSGDLNDVINTRRLASVSCIMTNIPGSITKIHTIEERLIPVQLRPQGQ